MKYKNIKIMFIFSFFYSLLSCSYAEDVGMYFEKARAMVQTMSSGKSSSNFIKGNVGTDASALLKIKCPYSGKEFEVYVDKESDTYKAGQLKVVSPYSGKEFFIGENQYQKEKEHTKNLIRTKIKSPYTGQLFTREVDVSRIFTSSEGIKLTCPYTNQKFSLNINQIKRSENESLSKENLIRMVKCPDTGKYFNIKSENGEFPAFTVSPYSGNKFLLSLAGQRSDELSKIEKIFSKDMNGIKGISMIRQFGYAFFEKEKTQIKTNIGSTQTQNRENQDFESLNRNSLSHYSDIQQKVESIPVSLDYILGPNDLIIVNIWGKAQKTFHLTIDAEGKVILPEAGILYLWGQTFKTAKKMISNALNKYYTNIKFDISMGRLRTIKIHVMGNVNKPGSYVLNSQATVLSALISAEGPNKQGSLRGIIIKRSGKEDQIIDLYDLFLKLGDSKNISLESEDIVFVSDIKNIVGIAGAVKRPAIYETNKRVTLKQVFAMAGGFSYEGLIKRIQIIRVEDNIKKINIDLKFKNKDEFDKKADNFEIMNGDLIIIFSVSDLQRNNINIDGNILYPGKYSLAENMTLYDLIEKAGGFLPNTYLNRIEIIRKTKTDVDEIIAFDMKKERNSIGKFLLAEWDRIKIFSISDVLQMKQIEIKGSVSNPGKYEYFKNMRISDLIFKAGGLISKQGLTRVEVYRQKEDGNIEVKKIDFNKIRKKYNDINTNLILLENDLLIIRGKEILNSNNFIELNGAVRYPGQYLIVKGDTISSLVSRAGGYTEKAFLKGIIFTRKGLKQRQHKMVQQLILEQKKYLLKEESELIKGGQAGDGSTKKREETLRHREELLNLISSSKIIGRMVIKVSDDPSFEKSAYDLELKSGDILSVPELPISVHIIGSVYNQTSILYEQNKGIGYYINKVGGYTKQADRRKSYIIKANGEINSKFIKVVKIERGDTIIIPEKFRYKTPMGILVKDTIQILYQMALGAAVVSNLN